MHDWTRVPDAISQLLELIDDKRTHDEYRFRLARITVEPDKNNPNNGHVLVVAAFESSGRAFRYAMFVRGDEIIADGY